ncbi:Hypothetical predicted protein [Octopus vulgaris]|uniref:Uncharacterized protein n=1 Tax=Octopus vulgaris TaxID=6645 RepID=A0AA36BLL4_OCTVU|nr:Hypothetical predicted protein [Octopus vulgaris]
MHIHRHDMEWNIFNNNVTMEENSPVKKLIIQISQIPAIYIGSTNFKIAHIFRVNIDFDYSYQFSAQIQARSR